ncbi:hypothetical protein PMKS-000669 [Pichia membranifaciens]|uniref:Thioredoxin domain-containing protein n=1 Tax=Pichia membranifaciens TaxID=4926 RepID=A0A1Q2YCF1_9ASCO|nr:hypothetical protein PMKS-000669 [Pichia membranifaciens]
MPLMNDILLVCWLLLGFNVGISQAVAKPSTDDDDDLHSRVPPPLTSSDFDKVLQEGFHVVEFFSPYCPHCTQLFPNWVEFYEYNQNIDGKDSKDKGNSFQIHQVDCVASGDLCEREGIQYYPMIRFYGAGSKLLGSMTNTQRDVDTMNEFANDQIIVWSESEDDDDSGASKLIAGIPLYNQNKMIKINELLKIIEGENKVPKLISFWPTTESELNDQTFQNDYNQNKFFSYYPNLHPFRNLWNLSMRKLKKFVDEDKLEFNYFNCKSNPEICEALGFKSLTASRIDSNLLPQVVLYLPKTTGGNAIFYNLKINDFRNLNTAVKSLTHWTQRTLINSELEDMKFQDIQNFIGSSTKLNGKGSISDITDYSKVAFIQVNDPESAVPEDDALLSRLIQPVADLTSDVYLFKTTDKDAVRKFLKNQEEQMANKYIHSGIEDAELKFDEKMFLSRTHTTFPMMICIKSGSLYSPVFTSFMSKHIRDYNKVLTFIKRNQMPTINHLTINSKSQIFPPTIDETINSKTEKVLITLTDFQPKQYFDVEFFMSYVFHKFTFINNKDKFNRINEKRSNKYDKVGKLRAEKADSDDIIDALREKVDISYTTTDNQLYPVYVDTKKLPEIVSAMKWSKLDPSRYTTGDVILVDRFNGQYWDEDDSGHKLTIEDPSQTVSLLEKVSYKKLKGKSLKHISLFAKIPLYSFIAILIFMIYRAVRMYLLKRTVYIEKMKGLGILGVCPELEESKFD